MKVHTQQSPALRQPLIGINTMNQFVNTPQRMSRIPQKEAVTPGQYRSNSQSYDRLLTNAYASNQNNNNSFYQPPMSQQSYTPSRQKQPLFQSNLSNISQKNQMSVRGSFDSNYFSSQNKENTSFASVQQFQSQKQLQQSFSQKQMAVKPQLQNLQQPGQGSVTPVREVQKQAPEQQLQALSHQPSTQSLSSHQKPNFLIQQSNQLNTSRSSTNTNRQSIHSPHALPLQKKPNVVPGPSLLEEKIHLLLEENRKLNDIVRAKDEKLIQSEKELEEVKGQISQKKIHTQVSSEEQTNRSTSTQQQQSLEQELKEQKDSYAILQQQFKDLHKRYISQEEQLEIQSAVSEKYKDAFMKIEEKISDVIEENQKLNILIEQKDSTIRDLSVKSDNLLQENKKFAQMANTHRTSSSERESVYKSECDSLKEALQEKNEQLIALQTDCQSYAAELKKLGAESDEASTAYKLHLEQYQKETLEKNTLIENLKQTQSTAMSQTQNENQELESKLQQVINENEKMVSLLQECETSLVQLKKEKNDISIEKQQLLTENETFKLALLNIKSSTLDNLKNVGL